MANAAFETDINFIEQALNDFLRDKKLQLTSQQYEKLKKLLMVRRLEEEMSYANAYNHLSTIMEYRKDYEINANALEEAEEEMIRIIGAADTQEKEVIVESTHYKKRFLIAAGLLVLLCALFIGTKAAGYYLDKQAQKTAIITTAEENEIKSLVAQVVALEKEKGNEITAASVYNEIKNLESVQAHGPATSYKKFNRAQYQKAVFFLSERLKP